MTVLRPPLLSAVIFSITLLFFLTPLLLAGMARWRKLLRAGGAAGFCFPALRDPPGFGTSRKSTSLIVT